MDCPTKDWPTDREYVAPWGRRIESQRVPFSGTVELTRRCNLRCVHCYLGDQEAQRALRDEELSTAELLSILDQVAEAGCLYLLITGGEPLLRPDLPEIYRRAKQNGLLVTLFTNGTLVDDELVALLLELPPQQVEITLYGATAGVYEAVTGVPGSYARCLAGIERLLRAGIPLALKTILMAGNRHEFAAIQEMARGFGVKFRFDAAITPCLDGGRAPLALRVSPEEAVEVEFADEKRRRGWREYRARRGSFRPTGKLYECGAGLTGFHVDPFGRLQMCLMAREPGYSLRAGSFAEGWHEAVPPVRGRMASPDNPCIACESRELCGYCPGFLALENGSEERPSEYLCELGRRRAEKLARDLTLGPTPRREGETARA